MSGSKLPEPVGRGNGEGVSEYNRLWRAKTPQVEACSKYVRGKRPRVGARKGSHGMVVLHYCVSGGCLLSLSICRSFQDLLQVRPSSLFILCGFISSLVASLMSRSTIRFLQKEILFPVVE